MMKKYRKIISNLILIISLMLFSLSFNNEVSFSAFMDYVIFIDPGHGGNDNGANFLDVYEDEINLSIASKLYELLLSKNIITYINRVGDYDLASQYSKNRKKEDLYHRSENIIKSNCDIFISLHVNDFKDVNVHGPMVYYSLNNEESNKLALCVQEELNLLTNEKKNIIASDFYLFRKCNQPGILIECGFISNEEERYKLLNEDYQQSLVHAIYTGIYNNYIA